MEFNRATFPTVAFGIEMNKIGGMEKVTRKRELVPMAGIPVWPIAHRVFT